jgi:hypothetical protein
LLEPVAQAGAAMEMTTATERQVLLIRVAAAVEAQVQVVMAGLAAPV